MLNVEKSYEVKQKYLRGVVEKALEIEPIFDKYIPKTIDGVRVCSKKDFINEVLDFIWICNSSGVYFNINKEQEDKFNKNNQFSLSENKEIFSKINEFVKAFFVGLELKFQEELFDGNLPNYVCSEYSIKLHLRHLLNRVGNLKDVKTPKDFEKFVIKTIEESDFLDLSKERLKKCSNVKL